MLLRSTPGLETPKRLLALARHHLVADHLADARAWSAKHWLDACAAAREEGVVLPQDVVALQARLEAAGFDQGLPKFVPDGAALEIACRSLATTISGADENHRFWARFLRQSRRDAGVVFVTLLVMGGAYRKYGGQSLNLWSKEIAMGGFEVTSFQQDWGALEINQTVMKQPIRVRGRPYARGFGTHANSILHLKHEDGGKSFSGVCALPDSARTAGVFCSIELAGKEVWRSTQLSEGAPAAPFSVALDGQKTIDLRTTSATASINGAHVVWVSLRVE